VTYLGGHEPTAALVHDPGAVVDPALLRSVTAVARIAVSNARLQSAVRERLDELVDSRRRVVEAADAQRERLERRLRSGPQEKLTEVRRALATCRSGEEGSAFASLLEETIGEVDRAREELSEFARGVRPRALSEGGIGSGVAELARRSTLPVRVSAPSARFSPALEVVAYFVCAEALANAGKHAAASRASIDIVHKQSHLEITVSDDGRGGADVTAGSGLRRLRDRVEALSGVLTVESPGSGGTRLHALLPVESA
jgi:signal transduction histidine kinase